MVIWICQSMTRQHKEEDGDNEKNEQLIFIFVCSNLESLLQTRLHLGGNTISASGGTRLSIIILE